MRAIVHSQYSIELAIELAPSKRLGRRASVSLASTPASTLASAGGPHGGLMLLSLRRGQKQLLFAVLERLVDRVEALCLRRTVGLDGISQDLVREEESVNGAALGDAAEDEHDGRGR